MKYHCDWNFKFETLMAGLLILSKLRGAAQQNIQQFEKLPRRQTM